MQLYAPPLRDRGNARREAARKTGEDEFDRGRSIVLGRNIYRQRAEDSGPAAAWCRKATAS